MQKNTFITNNYLETQEIGREFVLRSKILHRRTKGPVVICLYGNLGAGKTTLVQGVAKGLGIKKRIISPTFIIVRTYKIKDKGLKIKNFYHIDLYRIDTSQHIESLGLNEILSDRESIVVVEWAEKLGNLLPKKRIDIHIEHIDGEKRRIKISNE